MISRKTDGAGKDKKPRADGQLTALAGEFFVAAELLRRGLQCSITFGNAKAIDLFAYNPAVKKKFTVQVKALRQKNAVLISSEKVSKDHIYVFVILNRPGEAVEYYVVPGQDLLRRGGRFGSDFHPPHSTRPGIPLKYLLDYKGIWNVFDE